MKQPCDTCKVFGTYYEYPCTNCIHNPHSNKEIEEEIKSPIGDKADFYKHFKNAAGEYKDISIKGE